ncbi:Dabb family protein [Nocardia puris]|uniref:Stress responsive alpha/beta barrel protein n=1 Tax=Nocardia puris TaxID=208602 RepID=A0A366D7P0_9NOCA|nr:Dabb family protein [Nocardia puris]RBO85519.1 stress responsive alpha/beta barrel protein [Nocardia puris]
MFGPAGAQEGAHRRRGDRGAVGRGLGAPEEGYTHGLVVAFDDLDALERYLYDPVHLAGDPEILPYYGRMRVGPAITDDPDPDLLAKIGAPHEAKLAKYPEWAPLMDSIPEVRIF